MKAQSRGRRWRRLAAALVVYGAVGTDAGWAQEPGPLPTRMPVAPPVEIYYGIRKVSPAPQPAPPTPAPIAPIVTPVVYERTFSQKSLAAIETLRAVHDGAKSVSSAAVNLFVKIGDRIGAAPINPQPIILTSYSPAPAYLPLGLGAAPSPHSATPWLTPTDTAGLTPAPVTAPAPVAPSVPAPSPPTVVVVREPAPEARPVEPARGWMVGVETLFGFGVGALGVAFGLVAWARGARPEAVVPPAPVIVAPPAPPPENAVKLLGIYNAGPLPETAEAFEIGPTYHEELQTKKQTEEANNQAAVEFLLTQNLALLAALGPGADIDSTPAVGPAGIAQMVDELSPPTTA